MLYEDVNYNYFEYVVNKQEPSKVCFGSGQPRRTLFDTLKYQIIGNPQMYTFKYPEKIRSKRGTPGLGNKAKRMPSDVNSFSPGPAKYWPGQQTLPVKQSCAPFNTTGPAQNNIHIQNNPGPTVYNAHKVKLCKRTRFDYNFGNPCLVPYVETICINYPKDKCIKCEQPFEYGDHWHKKHTIYLCTPCMAEEHRLHEMFTKNELLQFKKIRTCTFMHKHEGTSAKVRVMSQKDITKKIRLENYLSLYSQCYGTKSKTELVVPLNDEL